MASTGDKSIKASQPRPLALGSGRAKDSGDAIADRINSLDVIENKHEDDVWNMASKVGYT